MTLLPTIFTCSQCKSNHPSDTVDPNNNVVQLPPTITTRNNKKGEREFVCIECDKEKQ
jgi:transcription elongation factor Elf1